MMAIVEVVAGIIVGAALVTYAVRALPAAWRRLRTWCADERDRQDYREL